MALESFYGGKPGVSPVIKGTFKFINTNDPWYQEKLAGSENENILTEWEAKVLNSNNIKNDNNTITGLWAAGDTITWTEQRLAPFTMDECFKSSSYKKVWYNELCIIDTSDVLEPNKEPTGSTHGINNPNNGKIYRRTLRRVTDGTSNHESSYAEYIGRIIGPQGVRGLRGYMGWRGLRGLTLEAIEHIDSINNWYTANDPIFDIQDVIEYDLNTDTYSFKEDALENHQRNNTLSDPNYHYSWLVGKWTFYNPKDSESWRVSDPQDAPIEDPARSDNLDATTFYTKICDLSFSAIQATILDKFWQLLILYTQPQDRPFDDDSNITGDIDTSGYYKKCIYNNQTWIKGTQVHPIEDREQNIRDSTHWWLNLGVIRDNDGIKIATEYATDETNTITENLAILNNPDNPNHGLNIVNFDDGLDHKGQLVLVKGKIDSASPTAVTWAIRWDYENEEWVIFDRVDLNGSTALSHRVYTNIFNENGQTIQLPTSSAASSTIFLEAIKITSTATPSGVTGIWE